MTRHWVAWVACTLFMATACDDDPQRVEVVDPCTVHPCSTSAVVTQLRDAYAARDPERFAALLHPDFLFILKADPLEPSQPVNWGRAEEVRIHQRMFRPQAIVPPDLPVHEALWVTGITISLAAGGAFVERPEYYASPTNPGGFDSLNTRVWGVDYHGSVLWETRGETDYLVTGSSNFVIVENRTLNSDAPGAFLLYRWQDLGAAPLATRIAASAIEQKTWSHLKALYR